MEYIVQLRVVRGDDGWGYRILFTSVYPRVGLPAEQFGPRVYETEQRATTAGLRALSAAISRMRRTAPVKVMR
jgi:hypothetical protein